MPKKLKYFYLCIATITDKLIIKLVNVLNLMAGGVLGYTFACILREQYYRLAYGDRYFFTHGNNVGSRFTQAQV